ncbi:MAG: hypothetical protein U0V73_08285 [Acidimicrobiia bacterium]
MTVSEPPRPKRRRRGRWVVAAIVLVVALVAGAFVWSPWSSSKSAPPTRRPVIVKTVWEKITDGIRPDGTVPKDVALQAYAYTHKLKIPGVQIPSGAAGDDYPRSGTGAVQWLEANWPALTTAQRRAILDENAGRTAAESSSASGGSGRSVPRRLRQPDQAYQEWVDQTFRTALDHLASRLGLTRIADYDIAYSLSLGGNTLMETVIQQKNYTFNGKVFYRGDVTPCNLTIFAFVWNQGLSPKLESVLKVLLTHEAVHCYQNTIWKTPQQALTRPSWVTEGTATFLATDDVGYGEPGTASFFREGYMKLLYRNLFTRTYDAVGYYALLRHLGRDLWGHMADAWRAAATSSDQSGAFISVLDGDAEDVRSQWGPSYARQGKWADPWVMYGTGLPDDATTPPFDVSIIHDGTFTDQLESRANRLYTLNSVADEVLVAATATGRIAVHDNDDHSEVGFLQDSFCLQESCKCPEGTPLAGRELAATQLRMPATLTFGSEPGGGVLSLKSESLEEACGKPKEKKVPPKESPPCPGGRCGQSNGDPHLITIDQTGYDFQAAGEFVLLHTGDLELQARQEPVKDFASVSINTAVAAKLGGTRVGVYQGSDGLTLHLDGKPTSITGTKKLADGSSVTPYADGFELRASDGTKVYVVGVAPWGLNVVVVPSRQLVKDATGLLGRTGGGFAVPALADGTELPLAKSTDEAYDFLYTKLADSWRVTDATTLFDYESGRSTATFTKQGFPAKPDVITRSKIKANALATGNDACRSVSDSRLREQCSYDVAVTGDRGYATNYRRSDALMTRGPTALRRGARVEGPTGTTSPSKAATTTTAPPGNLEPVLTKIGGVPALGAAIGPDGAAYVAVNGTDKHEIVKIVDGKIVQRADAPNVGWVGYAAGSVWVSNYGTDSCKLGRLDPSTLAAQATVDAGCGFLSSEGLGPSFTVAGDAVWFTGSDANNQPGLQRVDPATNRPATGVTKPEGTSYVTGTKDALFAFDNGKLFRLKMGDSKFEDWSKIAPRGRFFADGPGVWTTDGNGHASYYESPDSATRTVSLDQGSLVGVGGGALFVERSDKQSRSTLWRVDPSSGGQGTEVGPASTTRDDVGNEVDLSYFDDPPPIVDAKGAGFKYWTRQAANGGGRGWDLFVRNFGG